MAKVLRDLAADERSMSEAIRLPEYKCEWLDEAATLLEAIAMEARQGGDAEERLHAKHDSAAIAQRGSE